MDALAVVAAKPKADNLRKSLREGSSDMIALPIMTRAA
jgi:hypothetical protein